MSFTPVVLLERPLGAPASLPSGRKMTHEEYEAFKRDDYAAWKDAADNLRKSQQQQTVGTVLGWAAIGLTCYGIIKFAGGL